MVIIRPVKTIKTKAFYYLVMRKIYSMDIPPTVFKVDEFRGGGAIKISLYLLKFGKALAYMKNKYIISIE
jgi:hypothetical protein